MKFDDWARRYPEAAAALAKVDSMPDTGDIDDAHLESHAQRQARLDAAGAGITLWRNNVGALAAKIAAVCPQCQFRHDVPQQPLRYGLCNDSQKINRVFKSADLIGIEPLLVLPEHVGQTVGLFRSVEVKRQGWKFSNSSKHDAAQKRWADLVKSKGGKASFYVGNQDYEL